MDPRRPWSGPIAAGLGGCSAAELSQLYSPQKITDTIDAPRHCFIFYFTTLGKIFSEGLNLIKFSFHSMTELDSSVHLKIWEQDLSEASTDIQNLPEKVLS